MGAMVGSTMMGRMGEGLATGFDLVGDGGTGVGVSAGEEDKGAPEDPPDNRFAAFFALSCSMRVEGMGTCSTTGGASAGDFGRKGGISARVMGVLTRGGLDGAMSDEMEGVGAIEWERIDEWVGESGIEGEKDRPPMLDEGRTCSLGQGRGGSTPSHPAPFVLSPAPPAGPGPPSPISCPCNSSRSRAACRSSFR